MNEGEPAAACIVLVVAPLQRPDKYGTYAHYLRLHPEHLFPNTLAATEIKIQAPYIVLARDRTLLLEDCLLKAQRPLQDVSPYKQPVINPVRGAARHVN